MSKNLQERSKYLSYLLRHKPEQANLTLDKEGWCSLDLLLKNTDFTFLELCEIVDTDTKGRYSFDQSANSSIHAKRIRANQGHSTEKVRLTHKKAVPPVLYHGTTAKAFETIIKQGLEPMSRQHVHLSENLDIASAVGKRHGKDIVILKIDTAQMLADGFNFYLSENGVWLADAVNAKYISQEQC